MHIKVNSDACAEIMKLRKKLAQRLRNLPLKNQTRDKLAKQEQNVMQYQVSDYFPLGRLSGAIKDKVFALEIDHKNLMLEIPNGYVVFEVFDKQAERPQSHEAAAENIRTILKKKYLRRSKRNCLTTMLSNFQILSCPVQKNSKRNLVVKISI